MSVSPISTQGLVRLLLQPTTQTQAQLAKASVEMATGQHADLGLALGGRIGAEIGLRNEAGLLEATVTSNSLVALKLDRAQASLSDIRASGQASIQSLAQLRNAGETGAGLKQIGASGMAGLIGAANTAANGEYVFGGVNSGVAPMKAYESDPPSAAQASIAQAFQTTFGFAADDPAAASITASQMQQFLDGPFAALFAGTNWTNDWSSASSENAQAQISPGRLIESSTNINNAGFQQLARAYAMLDAFGHSRLGSAAMQAVATSATSLLSGGLAKTIESAATIGAVQQAIETATASMSSQIGILRTQIGNLDNVDPNEAAARVLSLQTQLQASYELAARLHGLNLAQFI